MKARIRIGDLLANLVLTLGAVVVLLPLIWMVLTSLKPPEEIYSANFSLLPERIYAVENYRKAFTQVPLLRFMLNGVIVVGLILFLQILIAAPCGYALAKLDFPGRPFLFGGVLVGLLIPIQVPALPIYMLIAKLGLLDTYTALVFPWVLSVFAIFLFRQFFKTFPSEIIDAARIDGFGELSIVWRIVMPSALPAVAAFSVFSIIAHWSDLYWPLVVVTSPEMMTPPQGVAFFRETGNTSGDLGALMAASVVVTAPLVIVFLFAQRQFMSGLSMSGSR